MALTEDRETEVTVKGDTIFTHTWSVIKRDGIPVGVTTHHRQSFDVDDEIPDHTLGPQGEDLVLVRDIATRVWTPEARNRRVARVAEAAARLEDAQR
jgi:hypothetical protein